MGRPPRIESAGAGARAAGETNRQDWGGISVFFAISRTPPNKARSAESRRDRPLDAGGAFQMRSAGQRSEASARSVRIGRAAGIVLARGFA